MVRSTVTTMEERQNALEHRLQDLRMEWCNQREELRRWLERIERHSRRRRGSSRRPRPREESGETVEPATVKKAIAITKSDKVEEKMEKNLGNLKLQFTDVAKLEEDTFDAMRSFTAPVYDTYPDEEETRSRIDWEMDLASDEEPPPEKNAGEATADVVVPDRDMREGIFSLLISSCEGEEKTRGSDESLCDDEHWGRPPEKNAGGATAEKWPDGDLEESIFSLAAVGCDRERVEKRVGVGWNSWLLDLGAISLGQAQTPFIITSTQFTSKEGVFQEERGVQNRKKQHIRRCYYTLQNRFLTSSFEDSLLSPTHLRVFYSSFGKYDEFSTYLMTPIIVVSLHLHSNTCVFIVVTPPQILTINKTAVPYLLSFSFDTSTLQILFSTNIIIIISDTGPTFHYLSFFTSRLIYPPSYQLYNYHFVLITYRKWDQYASLLVWSQDWPFNSATISFLVISPKQFISLVQHLREMQGTNVTQCLIILTNLLPSKGDSSEGSRPNSLGVRWRRDGLFKEFLKNIPMDMEAARLLFDKMPVTNFTDRNIVIGEYTKNNDIGVTIELFWKLQIIDGYGVWPQLPNIWTPIHFEEVKSQLLPNCNWEVITWGRLFILGTFNSRQWDPGRRNVFVNEYYRAFAGKVSGDCGSINVDAMKFASIPRLQRVLFKFELNSVDSYGGASISFMVSKNYGTKTPLSNTRKSWHGKSSNGFKYSGSNKSVELEDESNTLSIEVMLLELFNNAMSTPIDIISMKRYDTYTDSTEFLAPVHGILVMRGAISMAHIKFHVEEDITPLDSAYEHKNLVESQAYNHLNPGEQNEFEISKEALESLKEEEDLSGGAKSEWHKIMAELLVQGEESSRKDKTDIHYKQWDPGETYYLLV